MKRANASLATRGLPPLPELRVYAQATRRDAAERDELAALIAGEMAHRSTGGAVVPTERARSRAA